VEVRWHLADESEGSGPPMLNYVLVSDRPRIIWLDYSSPFEACLARLVAHGSRHFFGASLQRLSYRVSWRSRHADSDPFDASAGVEPERQSPECLVR
jgi:hypothetical protein